MPEQITIKPNVELNSTPSNSGQANENVNLNSVQLANVCAAGVGICFFLPWIQIFGYGVSPFTFQKTTSNHLFLWLIPIFSAITIFGGITKRGQSIAACLTGLLPFVVAAYWFSKL